MRAAGNATSRRLELAAQIVQSAPRSFGGEAAVGGSASRGTADEDSDVDIDFWVVGDIPNLTVRQEWLAGLGASDVTVERDGRGLCCRLGDYWVELHWLSEAQEGVRIERLLAGSSTDREDLVAASAITTAMTLRSSGRLGEWKTALSKYPDPLRERLIVEAADFWRFPHRVRTPYVLARRGLPFVLNHWIAADARDCVRILCALNRCWEPDWKALGTTVEAFDICPDQFVNRLSKISASVSPRERAVESTRMIRDVLQLAAACSFDVTVALAVVESVIAQHQK